MRRYCSVQERSYKAVREKLYTFGLHKDQVESIIGELIGENFLNEQRFADAFASGRFRIKGWGRRKIEMGLRQWNISKPCINAALAAIDPEEYHQKLRELVEKRAVKEKGGTPFERKMKVTRYLVGRGFEPDMVRDTLEAIIGSD